MESQTVVVGALKGPGEELKQRIQVACAQIQELNVGQKRDDEITLFLLYAEDLVGVGNGLDTLEVQCDEALTTGELFQPKRLSWCDFIGIDIFGIFAEFTIDSKFFRMRYIRPGSFFMGAPDDDEEQEEDEGPRHHVRVSKGFWLGEVPCTQKQWKILGLENPSTFKDENRPVDSVSFEDTLLFLEYLNKKARGIVFSLPTEAQWEYACRAEDVLTHSELEEHAWIWTNSDEQTWPVAQRKPNPWGLYDMHGNVWEWCADWYGPYSPGPINDPVGPPEGSQRILRGGAWNSTWEYSRCTCRHAADPSTRDCINGFRLYAVTVGG